MLDALAADRLRGEESNEVFAFGSYENETEEETREEWKAKGVVAILYHDRDKNFYCIKH
ncbi:MAG: hypothetical protein R3B95_04685 [Nitrospirales bacterium]|nr:hypothetical protein [Nitrospirales bacterium]